MNVLEMAGGLHHIFQTTQGLFLSHNTFMYLHVTKLNLIKAFLVMGKPFYFIIQNII